MPHIRGLDKYLRDRRLVHAGPLTVLAGGALALDAVSFFRQHVRELGDDPSPLLLGPVLVLVPVAGYQTKPPTVVPQTPHMYCVWFDWRQSAASSST